MFENMAGVVGMAMHEDRLTQATKNRRRVEAEAGRRSAQGAGHHGYRAGIAATLVALAARIAPVAALSGGQTRLSAR
jgi:hypothetical protein